jgi:3-hydroxyacyl-CoA dehydrogenase
MGTHFFSPANVMKLLENVRAKNTSDVTIASMMAWGKKIGKWVILVGNCRGFVGNRMVSLYSAQARAMLEEGLYPSTIDSAATNFGMRIGPLSMSDLVGLDLGSGALKKAGLWNPSKKIEHALVEKGRKGQKTGAGFYDYDSLRNQKSSPIVRQMIDQMFKKKKDTNNLDENEIQNRLFFPLINEGFNILQEGFARRPADIDVCYIHGYNFPRYRGGPMFHADAVGLPLVKETLEKLDIKPSKLLIDCIDSNMTLTKYWAKYGHVILKKAGPPKRRNEGKSKL